MAAISNLHNQFVSKSLLQQSLERSESKEAVDQRFPLPFSTMARPLAIFDTAKRLKVAPDMQRKTQFQAFQLINRLKKTGDVYFHMKEGSLCKYIKLETAKNKRFFKSVNRINLFFEVYFLKQYPELVRSKKMSIKDLTAFFASCEYIFKKISINNSGNLSICNYNSPTSQTSLSISYLQLLHALDQITKVHLKDFHTLSTDGRALFLGNAIVIAKVEKCVLEILLISAPSFARGTWGAVYKALSLMTTRSLVMKCASYVYPEDPHWKIKDQYARDLIKDEYTILCDVQARGRLQPSTDASWVCEDPSFSVSIPKIDKGSGSVFGFAMKQYTEDLHTWSLSEKTSLTRVDASYKLIEAYFKAVEAGYVIRDIKPSNVLVELDNLTGKIVKLVFSDQANLRTIRQTEVDCQKFEIYYVQSIICYQDVQKVHTLREDPKLFARFIADKINVFAIGILLYFIATGGHHPYTLIPDGHYKGYNDPECEFNEKYLLEMSCPLDFVNIIKRATNIKNVDMRPSPLELMILMQKIWLREVKKHGAAVPRAS